MDLQEFKIVEHTNRISANIWQEVIQWKHFEKDTIGKQLVRAADSISANLSEAYWRYSFADRKRFAYYARGSLCETINWLQISSTRGLIDIDKATILQAELDALSLRINVYIKRLKAH
ncbi:MAG: four helix bundle protein [Bacteroidia bacterium]|nr:MAG: four helix bundle protein [Bacteroidia bacterium]